MGNLRRDLDERHGKVSVEDTLIFCLCCRLTAAVGKGAISLTLSAELGKTYGSEIFFRHGIFEM